LSASEVTVVPAENRNLPSAALGWSGGGEVPTARNDPHGAAEPFFQVRTTVQPETGTALLHGRSGKVRFDLDSQPLLPRWIRKLRQVLQKRYQL
jgi:putative peptide zinc metalloprotease protein